MHNNTSAFMARCDCCGNECTLPFTCQHCGGIFCPECRLPPVHQCTGIDSWKKKPVPGVGISYKRGGTATATGSGYGTVSQSERKGGIPKEIPWLKILIAIVIIILLVILLLAMSL